MFLYYAIHIKKNNKNVFAEQDICTTLYLKKLYPTILLLLKYFFLIKGDI